jgi:rubrerythrin
MEDIKQILEHAIRDETYFYNFYNFLSEKALNEDVKQQLKRLASDELRHKQKLEAMKDFDFSDISELEVLDRVHAEEDASQVSLDSFNDIKSMLNFAIKQEVIANITYTKLAEACKESSMESVFKELATEEKKHELILTGKLALINQEFKIEW